MTSLLSTRQAAPKAQVAENSKLRDGSIKLVIWDLDETFWHGALADGDVEVDTRQRQRLIDLARRGVVSSICCKNEPGAARKRLQDEQVWAYFVFASISPAEKGLQVRNLLKRMRVPADSALFVDDSALERQEVTRANPGISCLSPESWVDLDVRHWGRDDPGLTRLGSYKLLESGHDESAEFRGSNLEFLRQSELIVTLTQLTPEDGELDSVVELVRRSHLLNFTGTRLNSGRAELVQYLTDSARVSFKVHARDRYEELGLCGLVSISRSGELEHFAFSCHVLDLGIEQAVFRRLGLAFPDLCVRFEVPLELEGPSDWVTLVGSLASSENRAAPPSEASLTLVRRRSPKSAWAARLWSLARATRVRRLFRAEALATYLSRRFETLLAEMQ